MNARKLKSSRSTRPTSRNDGGSQGRSNPSVPQHLNGRYAVRIARNAVEIASALRLRHEVFNVEIAKKNEGPTDSNLEFDGFDFKCRHLIVVDHSTGATVGTYRLNTIETAGTKDGFYSANEFTIDDMPFDILQNGIEIGRACVAKEHRNTKVLFLLWKGLLEYLESTSKRYFFGCCSIFSNDEEAGSHAYHRLVKDGHLHERIRVKPKHNALTIGDAPESKSAELPPLFDMYLRLGAKVCGPPMVDREFGTIDLFVVFDVQTMSDKYRRMFAR